MNRVEQIKKVIEQAESDSRKGNYRVYEEYKDEVGELCPTSQSFQDSMRAIAKALKV